jgi:bleomycin hydrolase
MEKSNLFLETMIAMRDRDIEDRSVQMYLDNPIGDGGWWQYFEGLIGKYGLVTSTAMPETAQSSKTGRINALLTGLLRKATAEIRRLNREGKKEKALREYKETVLADIYTMLVCTYGKPPREFTLRYEDEVDDSTKVLVEKTFTPLQFYEEYYGTAMPRFVSISNNPNKEYGKLFKFDGGRNVFENADMLVLNLPIDKLKEYAFKSILDSQVVWFACDVGYDNYNDSGIFAVGVYDYNTTFGINFTYSKADRLLCNDLSTNHAMALVGVDTSAAGQPRRWKVENSWGAKKGNSGYWSMYDDWFDEYVLMVMVDEARLDPDDAELLKQEPIIIEDWQPFYKALRNLQ